LYAASRGVYDLGHGLVLSLSGVQAIHITIFAPSKVHLLEIAGIRDALFEANCKIGSGPHYTVELVTEHGGVADTASGVR